MMGVTYIQVDMKKILFTFLILILCAGLQAQKITDLPAVTSGVDASLLLIRSGASGNVLSQITKANLLKAQAQSNITGLADSLLARYNKTQMGVLLNAKADTANIHLGGGSLTLSGHDAVTLTTTGATGVTLPTTGTLATTTQVGAKLDTTKFHTGGSAGEIILSGNDAITFTTTGATGITLPTSGTLLTSAGAETLSDLAPLLVDTIPLVTFGAGAGLTADTALFNNNVLIGSFYNEGSDTLVITQLMGVMKEGTGTETIAVQFSWHATMLSGSATSLNAAALAITSLTTGTEDVSFANPKIPPNVSYSITSNGGGTLTNRGVVYSTSANPTITDRKTVYTASVSSFTDVFKRT